MAARWRKGNCSLAWKKRTPSAIVCEREREKGLMCLSERDNDACFVCAWSSQYDLNNNGYSKFNDIHPSLRLTET